MNNKIFLNTERMLDFYRELDVIEFKYRNKEFVKENYQQLSDYESDNQLSMLTKKSYDDASQNLHLVYGEEKKTKESIQLVDMILNKIIGKYINIDGIERLFSMNYIDFEWEMHLSADYKNHNMKFYRDHFIHQIRDAYTAHVLLEQCGMERHVVEVLENESSSMISRYVGKILKRQSRMYQDPLRQEVLKEDAGFYMRNLIYMSMYMATLFHDIGYPEGHHLSSGERIIEYIAGIYNISDASASMHKISALLQNSLLFRLVPFHKIQRRIVSKRDHGAISAIIFLLNFYENGSIFCLPPYKSAAVELAALAIYNHTNVYSALEPKKAEYDTMRLCFAANPISYLLRMCDDLQEWDRTYFLVSSGSNVLFCRKCRTPILGVQSSDRDERHYQCNCQGAMRSCLVIDPDRFCFSQAFDSNYKFHYRRIYSITVCDEISLDTSRLEQGKLLVHLNYDTYKLLHAAYAHPTYAKYRISELNKLKRMLDVQAEMPKVYLEYFVTSNPVHIKIKIIENYMQKRNAETIPMLKEYICKEVQETLEHQRQIFERMKMIVEEKLSSIADEFCLHDNFCKECSLCGHLLDGAGKVPYMQDESGSEYNVCQREWDMLCLSWWVMNDAHETAWLKSKAEKDSRYGKLSREQNIMIPDFETMFKESDKIKGRFFHDREIGILKEALAETKERCPVRIMRAYMKDALEFYTVLYLCQQISRIENNRKADSGTGDGWGSFLRKAAENYGNRFQDFPDLKCLVEDCFFQFQKMYEDISALDYYPRAYYEQYANGKRREGVFGKDEAESAEFYYKAALMYISPENYVPLLERSRNGYIDGYTDLYFFRLLVKAEGNQSDESGGLV